MERTKTVPITQLYKFRNAIASYLKAGYRILVTHNECVMFQLSFPPLEYSPITDDDLASLSELANVKATNHTSTVAKETTKQDGVGIACNIEEDANGVQYEVIDGIKLSPEGQVVCIDPDTGVLKYDAAVADNVQTMMKISPNSYPNLRKRLGHV